MPPLVGESDTRSAHRQTANERQSLAGGFRGVAPLPVGAAPGVAPQVESRLCHRQPRNAEGPALPREVEYQLESADLRGRPRWHPGRVADVHTLCSDARIEG